MQINLNQSEIETAIKLYIVEQGFYLYGKDVEISFTAGRGTNGLTAEVDIEQSEEDEQEPLRQAYFENQMMNHPEEDVPELVQEECTDPVTPEVPVKTAASLFG